jgi:type III secretion system FlhB-like substrate exporter
MKNLTPEVIAKAKATKSAEELFALAKANNVELTEEEAKIYFE